MFHDFVKNNLFKMLFYLKINVLYKELPVGLVVVQLLPFSDELIKPLSPTAMIKLPSEFKSFS